MTEKISTTTINSMSVYIYEIFYSLLNFQIKKIKKATKNVVYAFVHRYGLANLEFIQPFPILKLIFITIYFLFNNYLWDLLLKKICRHSIHL